jgi:sortase B
MFWNRKITMCVAVQCEDDVSGGKAKKKSALLAALRRTCFAVCVCVMLVSGYKLLQYSVENKRAGDTYRNIGQIYVRFPASVTIAPTPTAVPESVPTAAPESPDDTPAEDGTPDDPTPETSYIDEPAPDFWPDVDFDGLRGVNPDFAAWFMCSGTNINYPVVHGTDNVYYLTHMFDNKANAAGALFIDYRNKLGFADCNTIIYGHHMRNHSMFWTLTRYKSQAYYDAHPVMRLLTPEGNFEVQVFSGFVADTFQDAWRIFFVSGDDFLNWIQSLRQRSRFFSDVPIAENDRIITLSTCDYEFNDARYVLYGKLVPVDSGAA